MTTQKMQHWLHAFYLWLLQDAHKRKALRLQIKVKRAFTTHPHETGESYLKHLLFTVRMSLRFVMVSVLLFTHGLFPFLMTRTASRQIEKIYLIMKSRIPVSRREQIDADWEI